jgi:[protein-PII] uridylyltransferase
MLTGVFERAGIDIAWAKVTTLGSSVVDAFSIVAPAADQREALERELFEVLPSVPPPKPVEEAS